MNSSREDTKEEIMELDDITRRRGEHGGREGSREDAKEGRVVTL